MNKLRNLKIATYVLYSILVKDMTTEVNCCMQGCKALCQEATIPLKFIWLWNQQSAHDTILPFVTIIRSKLIHMDARTESSLEKRQNKNKPWNCVISAFMEQIGKGSVKVPF